MILPTSLHTAVNIRMKDAWFAMASLISSLLDGMSEFSSAFGCCSSEKSSRVYGVAGGGGCLPVELVHDSRSDEPFFSLLDEKGLSEEFTWREKV